MAPKIITFLITFAINVCIGAAIFFFMIIAMNGFHESDATYGFATYIVLALIVSIVMSVAAALAVTMLMKKNFSGVSSSFIAIPIFSVIGAGLKMVCGIIGVLVADYVRVNY
jgi:hypothetical protein